MLPPNSLDPLFRHYIVFTLWLDVTYPVKNLQESGLPMMKVFARLSVHAAIVLPSLVHDTRCISLRSSCVPITLCFYVFLILQSLHPFGLEPWNIT